MTDKELFFKYNFIPSSDNITKEQILEQVYNGTFNRILSFPEKWTILLQGTYNCNANCIYCENHKLREQYHNATMPSDIIKQVVYKLGPNIDTITWHGGESLLLNPKLFILLKNEINKYNYNIKVNLQTNGILLTEEKIQLLKDLDMEWGTSFDGIFNTQNRGIQSTNAILNLINKNHKFGAICVLLENTVDHLIENYEYCKQIGLQGIQTCIVRENVIEASNPYLVDTNIALKELGKYYKHWIYDINNPIKDINLIRQTSRLLHQTQICEDTDCIGKWIIIDPFGNIATCGMNPLKESFININEIESYTDLLTNSKYILSITKQKILYENQCSDCKYLEVCYGGCMGLNYEINKDYKILNKRYCELVKGFLDIIYENIKNLDLSNEQKYNPYFLQVLKQCNYISLDEIKMFEREKKLHA